MPNQRNKGKRGERWFINNGLREIFPDIRRNAGTQAQSGGVDLENTPGFNFEVKFGKIIDQVQAEGDPDAIDIALVKPHREESYALIPFEDLKRLLKKSAAENKYSLQEIAGQKPKDVVNSIVGWVKKQPNPYDKKSGDYYGFESARSDTIEYLEEEVL